MNKIQNKSLNNFGSLRNAKTMGGCIVYGRNSWCVRPAMYSLGEPVYFLEVFTKNYDILSLHVVNYSLSPRIRLTPKVRPNTIFCPFCKTGPYKTKTFTTMKMTYSFEIT